MPDQFEVFPWNNQFNTDIKLIDQQHQQLVALLNELAYSLIQEQPANISRIFDQLHKYARVHFTQEEQIWAEHLSDDSWLEEHRDNHADFLPQLEEIHAQGLGKSKQQEVEEVIHFLIRWLAFHILVDDKRMALVLQDLQLGVSKELAKERASEAINLSLIDTVLSVYNGLSARTLDIVREKKAHQSTREKLLKLNQDLKQQTITDPLTGLHNRRFFDAQLEVELKRGARNRTPLTLMLIGLDHFRELNDQHGYDAGAQALQQVSQTLRELCRRPTDFIFRIGGADLALISADQSAEGACTFAEMVRAAIEALAIPNISNPSTSVLTASIGVYSLQPQPDTDWDQLFSTADQRLSEAKLEGGNRVICND